MEKLHYKSLRPGARHGMRKLWLVSITKSWKVTGSWVSGARVSNPPGWKKKDGMWLFETFGSNFSPMWQRDSEIDVAESDAINNSPRWEPGAVLLMLGRSRTLHLSCFILPDSEEDIQPGPLLWMPMTHQTLKPWQGALWAWTHTFEIMFKSADWGVLLFMMGTSIQQGC